MAYSRWMFSRWYTFWAAGQNKNDDYGNATFCICRFDGDITFTAKELRDDINKCMNKVRKEEVNVTLNEIKELEGYVREFLFDVEQEFKK